MKEPPDKAEDGKKGEWRNDSAITVSALAAQNLESNTRRGGGETFPSSNITSEVKRGLRKGFRDKSEVQDNISRRDLEDWE